MRRRLHSWLHRKGIARVLNSGFYGASARGDAYIEVRGPRFAAVSLARFALFGTPYLTVVKESVRVQEVETLTNGRRRVRLLFKRVPQGSRAGDER